MTPETNGVSPLGATGGAVSDYVGMVARHRPWRDRPDRRQRVSFPEFRQVVRRFPPSALLPALAELALVGGATPLQGAVLSRIPPWAIALAARESILWGNEHRRASVTGDSLRVLINAHNALREPDASADANEALDIMVRLAYEQFPYQESIFEEVARPHALMVEGAGKVPVEVLNNTAWSQLLGAPLGEVFGATFFLQVAANSNKGWFDPAFLDLDDLQPIYDRWPRDVIEMRASQLSSTFEEFKAAYEAVPHPPAGYERYAYNPLIERPFVRMPDGRLLAPQPHLILRTISPGALYYPGMKKFGQPFGRDLGHLTEHYVGEQLRSMAPTIDLHPEIVYPEGKNEMKSIDWFLVLPSVVIMFEVKSAQFGLLERAGFGDYQDKVQTLLNKATTQLERTSEQLDAGNPLFAHIPSDRPRIGIIVTREPHHLANSPWFREMANQTPFPTLTVSLRDIESLAALPVAEVERQLADIANNPDRSTWALSNALDLDKARDAENTLLQRAWDSYPWPEARNLERE